MRSSNDMQVVGLGPFLAFDTDAMIPLSFPPYCTGWQTRAFPRGHIFLLHLRLVFLTEQAGIFGWDKWHPSRLFGGAFRIRFGNEGAGSLAVGGWTGTNDHISIDQTNVWFYNGHWVIMYMYTNDRTSFYKQCSVAPAACSNRHVTETSWPGTE